MVNRYTKKIVLSHSDCESLLALFKAGDCFIDKYTLLQTPMYKNLGELDTDQALVIANTAGVVLFSEFHQDNLPYSFYIRQKSGGAFSYNFH